MQTALEVHTNLAQEAKDKNHQSTRVIPKMKVGQSFRQGDVYVTRIKELPSRESIVQVANLQLAKGETKGSRHILEQTDTLRVYSIKNPANALVGPVIESKEEIHLTHPEHAHFIFPAGYYSVHYQQDFQAEEIRAVRD
jgi:hypothetical protein